jgi:thiol-disulfide isomerase/thioredoxin
MPLIKKMCYVLMLPMLALLQARGQAVTIKPAMPHRGDKVTITYDPAATDAKINANVQAVTVIFSYSTFYDLPYKMPLQKKGAIWTATFTAGRFATFATFYLQSGEVMQQPAADRQYTIAVYDKKGRVKSSLLHESYSLSVQSPKSQDLQQRKLSLLEEELKHNPDNYEAKVAMLVARMAIAKTPAEKLMYRKQARSVIAAKLEENPTLPGNVNKVTMGYLMIGEKSRLDSVRKVIMTRFPEADISKDLRASIIGREKESPARTAKLEALLKNDKPGEEGSGTIHKMLFEHYAAVKDSVKALYHAARMITKPNPYLPQSLKEIAVTLTKNKIAPAAAIGYAGRSLSMVQDWPVGIIRYFPEFGYIPSFVPDSVRKQAVAEAKSAIISLQGLNYIKQGNRKRALELAKEAKEISSGREGLMNSAAIFAQIGFPQQAFDALWLLLLKNPTDTLVKNNAKLNFLKFNPSQEKFDQKLMELEQLEIAQLSAKMKTQLMRKPGPELSGLVDLEGRPVTPEMMSGKIVILDFWATWCVPCMQEMPYFQKVYEKYRDNPDVMFMVVNNGSNNTIDDARRWKLQNPQYTFPVYFNKDKDIGEKVGFALIPTIALIDKGGLMQFRTVGFEGEILQKKLAVEIEILLNK